MNNEAKNNKPKFIVNFAANGGKSNQVISARVPEMLASQFLVAKNHLMGEESDIAIPSTSTIMEEYLTYTIKQIEVAIASNYAEEMIPEVMIEKQKKQKVISVRVSTDVIDKFNKLSNILKEKDYSVPLTRVFDMALNDVLSQIKKETGWDYAAIDFDKIDDVCSLGGSYISGYGIGCDSCHNDLEDDLEDMAIDIMLRTGGINEETLREEAQKTLDPTDYVCEECEPGQ